MSQSKKRILIVEDDALIAEALRLRLEQLGYTVTDVAARGEDAVEIVAAAPPDLVLMDIRLAGRLDGVAAGEHIQTHFGLPVVYLTANTDRETLDRVLAGRPSGYVPKPINDAAFQSAISIAFQKDAMERAYRRQERYYASTLAKLEDAVLVLDADRRLIFLNPAAATLIGCSSDAKVVSDPSRVPEFVNEDGEVIDPIGQCLSGGEEINVERVWCRPRTGERALVSLDVIPLTSTGASCVGGTPETVEVIVLLRRAQASPPQSPLPAYIRVCAYCRDIMERNAEGLTVTKRFESYFQRLCGYQFTHGICPACRDALMNERTAKP